MKKFCAIIVGAALLLAAMGILTVGAEDESYTYERYEDLLADVVYQDFEDLEAMEDYATGDFNPYTIAGSGAFGFFSYCNASSFLMVTNENPISGDQSLMIKDFLDGRRWTIDQAAPFDGDAYVVEFKIRIDAMPADGKFTFKITDTNSPEKDNESEEGAILSFKNVDGTLGLYNFADTLVAELETERVYSVAVVCETLSTDCFLFLDGEYVPDSKAEFGVEFAQLSALRFDLRGSGAVIALDDLVADGCEVDKVGGATPTPEATETPTESQTASSATATPKPAAATSPAADSDSNTEGGFPTWAIVLIVVGVIVIIAAVAGIAVKKKKK